MAAYSSLRASDADRDTVAERLRRAAADGRLEPEELEERLHAALRARTYGDLQRLLIDLPGKPVAWQRGGGETMPYVRTVLAIAMRVAFTLGVVAVVLIVAAAMAAWWILCAIVWFGLCSRRFSTARQSHRPPRARRLQRAGLR